MSVTAPAPAPAPAPAKGTTAPIRIAGGHQRIPWIALGVFLVVGGALAAGLVVQSAGQRVSVLVAARPLSPGQRIAAEDLRVVDVALDDEVRVVSASQRSTVIGQAAVTAIGAGSMLAPDQFDTSGGLTAGTSVVGLLLEAGEVPVPDLRGGDVVEMVSVAGDTADSESLGAARVFTTRPGTQPGTLFVSLALPADSAVEVSGVAAQKRLRLVLTKPGGR